MFVDLNIMKKSTSWSNVANWYDELLKDKDSYQNKVILPNLLRILKPQRGQTILDLACGQGFFARAFTEAGAKVVGADISPELVALAKKHGPQAEFYTAPAHNLPFIKNASVDTVIVVLAIQNIENVHDVFKECARVLKSGGRLLLVLNHPCFRIPKQSSWGYDEQTKVMYRRLDEYLSESKVKIQMHPGDKPSEQTLSFHRPLQFYFKSLSKHGFAVTHLEEWNSRKKSAPGPRAQAEDKTRQEIPLFLFLEAVLHKNNNRKEIPPPQEGGG